MTLNNKLLLLPKDQLSWLLLSKDIFKRTFHSSRKIQLEFIEAIRLKALEKDYAAIVLMIDTREFELFFKN